MQWLVRINLIYTYLSLSFSHQFLYKSQLDNFYWCIERIPFRFYIIFRVFAFWKKHWIDLLFRWDFFLYQIIQSMIWTRDVSLGIDLTEFLGDCTRRSEDFVCIYRFSLSDNELFRDWRYGLLRLWLNLILFGLIVVLGT